MTREDWIGSLPPNWDIVRLGALGSLGKGSGGSKEDNRDSGVPVVRYGELYTKFDRVIREAQSFISPDDTHRYTPLPTGNLVFAGSGEDPEEIGKAALSLLSSPAFVGGDSLVFTPRSNVVDPVYLTYVLDSKPLRAHKAIRSTGFTVVHINAGKLKTLPVPLPPLDEQRAIVDYLDQETGQIDALVTKQEEFIGLLRERRTAVRREALTPAPDWKRTHIKQLAQTNLGKMLDAGREPRPGDFSAPYVRAADVLADGSVRLENLNEMPFSSREMSFFDLRRNDILIIEGGATVGRPAFLNRDAPGIAFQKTVNRLRPGPNLDPRFAYWSMVELYEADYYPNYFGAVSFVHLTGEKLREISLMHPPVEVQQRIGHLIDERTASIDALIAKAEEHIALAKERRAALITSTVTGQFDVRTAWKAG